MRFAFSSTRPHSPTALRYAPFIRSSTPTSSLPRSVRMGKQWREFQGANNWDGLLDPLDDTLRSEILRYGEFVQAAYTAFDFDPSSPSFATCRFPKHSLLPLSGLPSTGYRVTRNLHATTSARLPRWAKMAPSSLSRASSWIGYVAVCQDEAEIARLGRRDIVIAFRGTATFLEWLENLRASLTLLLPAADCGGAPSAAPMVERGFWNLFTTPGSAFRSLRDELREEVGRLLETYGRGGKPIGLTVTGHSLGAALAVLTAYDVTATFRDAPMVTVVSFGGPRVGNSSFRRRLEERGSKVLRIVNTRDIITKVPGFVLDGDVAEDDVEGMIPSWLLSKTGWVYSDVGRELRVSSQSTANVAACHDLNVYLNLVNQLSATCPLRAKVKKELWRPFATQATASQL